MNFDKLAMEIIDDMDDLMSDIEKEQKEEDYKNITFSNRPSSGAFYYAPTNRKMTQWKFFGDKTAGDINVPQEEEPTHFGLWHRKILPHLKSLGLSQIEMIDVGDNYIGLPRGRVQYEPNKQTKILHGNDLPTGINKNEVINFFNLKGIKVNWEFWSHEAMDPKEKKEVWTAIKK